MQRMTAEWKEFFCVYLNLKNKNAKKLHCRRLKSGEPHPKTHSLCILFVCLFFPAKGEFFLPTVVKRLYIEALLKVGVLPL